MDDSEIAIQPNEDDLLLGVEGDNFIHTPAGLQLPDSLLFSDDDTSGQHCLQQDKNDVDALARHPNEAQTATLAVGEHSDCEADQAQELDVESLSGGSQSGIKWRWGTAYEYLREPYSSRQKLYADLINEILYIERPDDKLDPESPWIKTLTSGPTEDNIEELRNWLFNLRCTKAYIYLSYTHSPEYEEVQRLADYYMQNASQYEKTDITVYSELNGLAEDDALRHAILIWKQKRGLPTTYNFDDEPKVGDKTRKVLTIDHIMARSTYAESNEAEQKCRGKSIEEAYATWREIETRVSKGLQESTVSNSTHDERRNLNLQQGATKSEMGEEPQHKMSTSEDNEEPRQAHAERRWKGFYERGSDYTCCAECTQCKELQAEGTGFRVGAHHTILVRAAIQSRDWSRYNDHHILKTFRLEALDPDHKLRHVDQTGTEAYWKTQRFYNKLYRETRDELSEAWPFDDFEDANISYKLKPKFVTYDGYNGGKVMTQTIPLHTTDKQLQLLFQPRHIIEPLGKYQRTPTQFGAQFTVHMTVDTKADKALLQRIQYADDKFAQRFKQILTDHRGADPIFTIGSLLLAFAAKQRDDIDDFRNPTFPPYPKTDMKDTMDKRSWENYTSLLDFYRKREKEAQQTCGSTSPTSSTPGPKMDTETSVASRNGTEKIQKWQNRDTSKKMNLVVVKSCKASTGTRYISKPAQPEKLWSNSTRSWTQNPIYKSHTAKSRPRSRDGGRDSSEVQLRRNVFERLANQAIQIQKDDEEDDQAKRSKISKSHR